MKLDFLRLGAQNDRNIINQDNVFTNKEFNFTHLTTLLNVDMLRPYGHLIRILAGANASMHLNLEEDDEDDIEQVIVLQTHAFLIKLFFIQIN